MLNRKDTDEYSFSHEEMGEIVNGSWHGVRKNKILLKKRITQNIRKVSLIDESEHAHPTGYP